MGPSTIFTLSEKKIELRDADKTEMNNEGNAIRLPHVIWARHNGS